MLTTLHSAVARPQAAPRSITAPARLIGLIAALAAHAPLPAVAQTVTLNPSKDATLIETATSDAAQRSNGGDAGIYTGRYFDGTRRRALVRFQVSGNVPAGSTITSVTLRLTCFSAFEATARTHSLRRMLRDWGEGFQGGDIEGGTPFPEDPTWKYAFFNTVFWNIMGAGGDGVDRSATTSATVNVGGVGNYTFASTSQMVADVQLWLNNPSANFGWLIIGNETTDNTDRWFASRENATAASRPLLTINYTAPGVAPIIADIPNAARLCGPPAYTGPTPSLIQGTPTVTWTLQTGPSGMTINSASGVVGWPNPVVAALPHTITIRASNSFGFDDETWTLTIRPGDFTGDGLVTSADILAFVGVLLGTSNTTACAADVNLNGPANGADVQAFVAALIGP